jgi:localization factor PodJL
MVSEASWQTGAGRFGNAPSHAGPMDQQSIESLLCRLMQRVEESERRYSEALDELHARLDQLSQTTDAARMAGSPEDAATFDRLHDQVSSLARRLEGEASTPLDDFERLGRALAGDLDYGSGFPGTPSTPDQHGPSPFAGSAPFAPSMPAPDYSAPFSFPGDDDLDKRLVDMAHRLEHSIGEAMPPQTLDALNARLDELGSQIAKALETASKSQSFDSLERQISEMAQQLGQAEAQLAKIGEIDSTLHKLLERVDASPSPEDVASKAAQEAARLVEAKLSAASAERLDTMHRDLMTMNDRTRASDDKLAGTIEAVHASLRQLVQQMEKPAPLPAAPKPRAPFADRMRDLGPFPEEPTKQLATGPRADSGEMPNTGMSEAAAGAVAKDALPKDTKSGLPKQASPRNRLAVAIADLEDSEAAPHFGRAKSGPLEERPFDLDSHPPRRDPTKKLVDAEYEDSDDLVGAARRAAQAAALKAEERSGVSRVRRLAGDSEVSSALELPSRRKRSFLIICAAVLLALSALLLYGRLRSKPEPEVTAPAAEQLTPAPAAPSEGSAAPGAEESAPAAAEPKEETPPATPDSSELQQEIDASPADNDVGDAGQSGNFTEVAKTSCRNASATEPLPQPQPVSLTADDQPKLPPGVVFSVEDPNLGG